MQYIRRFRGRLQPFIQIRGSMQPTQPTSPANYRNPGFCARVSNSRAQNWRWSSGLSENGWLLSTNHGFHGWCSDINGRAELMRNLSARCWRSAWEIVEEREACIKEEKDREQKKENEKGLFRWYGSSRRTICRRRRRSSWEKEFGDPDAKIGLRDGSSHGNSQQSPQKQVAMN